MTRRLSILSLVLVCFAGEVLAASSHDLSLTISGTVVDRDENPIPGAKVCAWGTGPMSGRLPCSQSDPRGRFTINVPRPDTYTLSAEHPSEGYPQAIWAFYGKTFATFPQVTIDAEGKPLPVKIRLAQKAGRMIFTIRDRKTNELIEKGSITVCRVGDPKSCWSMSTAFPQGRYELLTPDAPFTIKFQTWEAGQWITRAALDERDVPIEVLQVELAARKEMTVRLQ